TPRSCAILGQSEGGGSGVQVFGRSGAGVDLAGVKRPVDFRMSAVQGQAGSEMTAAARRRAKGVRWVARALFAAAAAWVGYAWWWGRSHPAPPPPPAWQPAWRGVDWSGIAWQPWSSRAYGLSLTYPAVFTVWEPFEQMVETPLGDLKKAPVAG